MRGIFLSKKLIVALICLLIVILLGRGENVGLDRAEARLISKMLESERLTEVFAMNERGSLV